MNVERGFRRITFVVSIVVGVGAWAFTSLMFFDGWMWKRREHLSHLDDYRDLKLFWDVWDANAWEAGQSEVLRRLLDSSYRGMRFTADGRTFTLYKDDVLPRISLTAIGLPSNAAYKLARSDRIDFRPVWEQGDAKKMQNAREAGLSEALNKCMVTQSFWTERTRTELGGLSIFPGLVAGAAVFAIVWLLFFLLRWIGRGFRTTAEQASA